MTSLFTAALWGQSWARNGHFVNPQSLIPVQTQEAASGKAVAHASDCVQTCTQAGKELSAVAYALCYNSTFFDAAGVEWCAFHLPEHHARSLPGTDSVSVRTWGLAGTGQPFQLVSRVQPSFKPEVFGCNP